MISTIGIAGIAAGSLLGSKMIIATSSRHIGINTLIIMLNLVAIIANLAKIILKFEAILFGRFVYGLCSGALNVCLAKVIGDTVPN